MAMNRDLRKAAIRAASQAAEGRGLRHYAPKDRMTLVVICASLLIMVWYLLLLPIGDGLRATALGEFFPAVSSSAVLWSMAIHVFVMARGAWTAMAGLRRFRRENGLLDCFHLGLEQFRDDRFERGESWVGVSFEELVQALRPTPVDGRASPMSLSAGQMFESLRQAAETLRLDPIAVVVEYHLPEVMAAGRSIRGQQTTAIRFGILGTFVGLISALSLVAGVYRAKMGDARATADIDPVLQSLAVAFLTSIAGLVAALLLQALSSTLGKRERAFADRMADVGGELQTAFVLARHETKLSKGIEALKATLEESRKEIREGATAMFEGGKEMRDAFVQHGEKLDQRLADLVRARDGVDDLAARQIAQIDRLVAVHGDLAHLDERLRTVFERVDERTRNVLERLAADQSAGLAGLRDEMRTGARETVEALRGTVGREALDLLRGEAKASLEAAAAALRDGATAQAAALGTRLDAIAERLGGETQRLLGSGAAMSGGFAATLDRLEAIAARQAKVTIVAVAVAAGAIVAAAGLAGAVVWTAASAPTREVSAPTPIPGPRP